MSASARPAPRPHERSVSVTRRYDAPRERVFECWTRAEHLAHWFGPAGFTLHSVQADPRPGGVLRLCMRAPDGAEHWVRGTYREVVPPERLVVHCVVDDEQGVERLSEVFTVTLIAARGGTRLTLEAVASGAGDEAAAMLRGMSRGWSETLERLGVRAAQPASEK